MKLTHYLSALALLFAFSCSSPKQGEDQEAVVEEVADATPEYVGEEVSYSTDSTTMNGYMAYDKNATDKKPGILVVHEWWGHNAYSRERADMLAKLGYVALAVDMYGNGKQAGHPEDAQKFAMSVMGNFDAAKARFEAAMETLKNNPNVDPEQIGAIGYCFGGGVVLAMADAGYDLDAVVAFHGTLQLPVMPEKGMIKGKVLVCSGADDPFVTPEQVAAYTAAMDSAQADYEYIAYEGAVHAFTSKGADSLGKKFDLPLAYNEAADKASWQEMKDLFNEVFTK